MRLRTASWNVQTRVHHLLLNSLCSALFEPWDANTYIPCATRITPLWPCGIYPPSLLVRCPGQCRLHRSTEHMRFSRRCRVDQLSVLDAVPGLRIGHSSLDVAPRIVFNFGMAALCSIIFPD
ncbi:uncharacterized protein F5147DRAFT_253179 [Suillus discolor]|uniref:Uncharacterized protein n=1 Tax=Suillus discolor TaxID=1912936 RepID=A0A9P7FJ82_9AGAM|nr:uncharacterized protein F5147DRAFT_253179 [Suillus discolor]KAG2117957.1 hypothetical protein F5147DRAFT_253179 [Suillus discolor]